MGAVSGILWFLVSFTGTVALLRALAMAALMAPGEQVGVSFMVSMLWPVVAWLCVLAAGYIVEAVIDECDS
jgi:hypothetical protein